MGTDTAQAANAGEQRKPKSFSRFIPHIVRVLLGMMFLFFGLNGFFNFMPPPKEMPEAVATVLGVLTKAGYIKVVSGAEVIAGLMLLLNRFVPLALALIAPIIVGIITFHVFVAPATIGPAIVVLIMELYLAWAYRSAFRPMLAARVAPG